MDKYIIDFPAKKATVEAAKVKVATAQKEFDDKNKAYSVAWKALKVVSDAQHAEAEDLMRKMRLDGCPDGVTLAGRASRAPEKATRNRVRGRCLPLDTPNQLQAACTGNHVDRPR